MTKVASRDSGPAAGADAPIGTGGDASAVRRSSLPATVPAGTCMSGPRIVAEDQAFRIVRTEDGTRVTYVMEVPDGCDALGCERWRDVKVSGTPMTALFNFVIRESLKGQADAETE
jgi:hypothetical protein